MAQVIDVVMRLQDAVTPALSTIRNGMEQTNSRVIRMGKSIESCGNNITAFSNKAAVMAAPLMAAAAAGVKLSSDFTNGMAKVSTLCDTTVVDMEKLRAGILQVSNDTGVAVTDLTQAQYQAISAGVDATKSVDFVRQATITAKAGFTDSATAIDGLTTVLNAYGMKTEEVTRISDQMLITQNLGKTTFGELAQSIGNVIPQAAALGVSTEELFGAFAALTKNGINTAESATGLKAALTGLLKPSADALKTAAAYGIELSAAHVKQVGFAGMLDEIKEKTGGNTEAMAKLFGSSRALTAVLALTGKASGDFKDSMSAMQKSSGATAEAYEKLMTPAERAAIAFNQLKNAGMEVSAGLAPIIKLSATMMKNFAAWLNGLSDSQRQFLAYAARNTVALILVTGVVGRLVAGVGRLVTVAGMIEKAAVGGSLPKKFKLIETAVQGVMKVFRLLRVASVAMMGPWGIVIAAVVAAAFMIYKNWDKIAPFFTQLWNRVKGAFYAALAMIQPAITRLHAVWEKLVSSFKSGDGIFKYIQRAAGILAAIFSGALYGAFVLVSSYITGVVVAAFNVLGSIVSAAIGVFSGLITFITGVFTGNWSQAWEGVVQIFSSIFEGIVGVCSGVMQGIKSAINSVISGINNISVDIPQWVPGVGGNHFGLNIPMLYTGTERWRGGPAMIHDRGAEIVDLPGGSRVIPHDQSIRAAYNMGASSSQSRTGGGITINISSVTLNNGGDIKDMARKVAEQIQYEMEKRAINNAVGAI